MEHRFQELPIETDNGFVFASGTACLEADDDADTFWVQSVALDGPQGKVWLNTGGGPLDKHLFYAVVSALEDSPEARDAWAAHIEDEAADEYVPPRVLARASVWGRV